MLTRRCGTSKTRSGRCERAGDFGPKFVELARSVYFNNDNRAAIKRKINVLLGSKLIEEKSYEAGSIQPAVP